MAHAREQIRDRVESLMITVMGTSSRVSNNRVSPFYTFPCANVMTLDEDVRDDLGVMNSNTQIRELRILVEIRDKDTGDLADSLDDWADEVEDIILSDLTLQGYAWDVTIESTSFSYENSGEIPVAKADMIFSFMYQTDKTDPSQIL